jgi:hypothetical protein
VIRGQEEKTYALTHPALHLSDEALAQASSDDLLRFVATLMADLLGAFSDRLAQQPPPEPRDIAFLEAIGYLSDEEYARLIRLRDRVIKWITTNPPTPERRRRRVART